jgi:hypothetical protein
MPNQGNNDQGREIMETQEITEVYVIGNRVQVGDKPSADDFISMDVFSDEAEADFAHTSALLSGLTPSIFRMDRIKFEGQLPEAIATSPVRMFVTRWDLPGHPGEAEMTDHLDHLMAGLTDQERVNASAVGQWV